MVETAKSNPVRGEGQLLQAMLAHWTHEDRLYWGQVRYLVTLQLALLAAWYALGISLLGAVAMVFAAVLTRLLYGLAETIRQNRDVNLPAIKIIAEFLATDDCSRAIQSDAEWGIFRFATHSLQAQRDAGRRFQKRLFITCICLNLLLAAISVHDYYSDPEDGWLRNVHPRFERTTAPTHTNDDGA